MKLLRRIARWLGGALLLVLVLLVAAVALLHTDWGRQQVRQEIEQALNERLAGRLSIGRVEGSVLGDLTLHDVVVENRAGQLVASVDTLRIDFALLPLISQRFEARLVSLRDLEVVDRGDLGSLWQPPTDEPTAWSVQVDRFEVHEGSYLRLRPDASPVRVHGIDLDSYLAASDDRVFVALRRAAATLTDGDARARDVGIRASGRVSVIDEQVIARDLEVTVGGSRVQVHSAVAGTDGAELGAVFEASVLPRTVDRFAPSLQWRAPIDLIGTVARDSASAPLRAWISGHLGTAPLTGAASITDRTAAVDLRVDDLRPQTISGRAPPGLVDLELTARARGRSLENLEGRVTLQASGRVRDVAALSVSGTMRVDDGALEADLEVQRLRYGKMRADRVSIEARGSDLFADAGSAIDARIRGHQIRYGDVRAKLVNLNAHASDVFSEDGRAWATVTVDEFRGEAWRAGRVRASGRVSELSLDANATLNARAQRVIIGDQRIGRVTLDATLRDRGTRARATARIGSPGAAYRGRIRLAARISEPSAQGGLTSRKVDLTIRSARLHTRQLTWTGSAAATIGPGARIEVDRLRLASAAGTVQASGTLGGKAGGALRFQLTDLDLGRIWRALPASVDVPAVRGHVQASGRVSLEPLRLAIEARGRNLAWTSDMPTIHAAIDGELTPDQLDATVSIEARRLGRAKLTVDLQPPARPLSVEAWLDYRLQGLRLARLALRDVDIDRAAALAGAGDTVQLEGRLHGVVSLADGGDDITADLRLTGARGWALRRPVDLHLLGTSSASRTELGLEVILDRVKLATGRLELATGLGAALRARPDALANTEVSGRLVAAAFPLRRLAAVFGADEPVTGRLQARADLTGTVGDPTIQGSATLTGVAWRDHQIRTASLSGRWHDGSWTAAARALQPDGGELRASASDTPRRQPEGQLWAEGLDLGVLSPMLRAANLPIYSIGGELAANVRVRDQTATGTLTVRDGSMRMTTGIRRVSNLDLAVDFRDRNLTLTARGRAGRGSLRIDGTATLPEDALTPKRVNAVVRLDDSPILAGGIRATVTGEARLQGTREDQLWRMDVAVSDGRLQLPADFRGRQLHPLSTPEDVRFASEITERAKGPVAEASAPFLRANIHTTEPIRIRSKGEVEARVVADLDLTLLDGATVISGAVELVRGSVTLFDQQYQVTRAALTFQGRSPPNPTIDVQLEHQYERVTLHIGVTGTLKEPRVQLSSDPPTYSRGELLGFVLGGQPGAGPRAAASLESGAISAASGLLAGRLESLLRRRAPFDTIRLGTDSRTETGGVSYVTVGRWISDDLFVAYHRRFEAEDDENANEALLEYQLSDQWTIRGAAGDRGAAHVDLLWVKRYD